MNKTRLNARERVHPLKRLITRKTPQNKNAKGCMRFAKGLRAAFKTCSLNPEALSIPSTLSILTAILLTGCATQRTVELAEITAGAYTNFLEQDKVAPLMQFTAPRGQTVNFSVTGAESVIFNTQVPALSMMPRSRDGIEAFFDGAEKVTKAGVTGLLGYKGISAMADIATSPTVVTQPEPLIVNPVVVGAE